METSNSSEGGPIDAAWKRYAQAKEDVRKWTEDTPRFKALPQVRAKGYHAIMEASAIAYNIAISTRMYRPRIYSNLSWQSNVYTLGQNGPDLYYATMVLDGKMTYRLTGRFNDAAVLLLQHNNHVHSLTDCKVVGNYDLTDFPTRPDGSFEVILSAAKQTGNWIPLVEDSYDNYFMFRRIMNDPHKKLADLQIERITEIPSNFYDFDEFDEKTVAARIDRAAGLMRFLVKGFNIDLYDQYIGYAGGVKNAIGYLPKLTTNELASPSSNYAMGVWEFDEDEAVLVELTHAPKSAYWGFQLGSVWSRSLDFFDHQTNLNDGELKVDGDGVVRIVISHRDTGVANWLDTCGNVSGTICFRNYKSLEEPVPSMKKVKLSDLDTLMPADTARVSAAQRTKAIGYRREGYFEIYQE